MQRQEQQGGEGEDDADYPDDEEMGARGAPPPARDAGAGSLRYWIFGIMLSVGFYRVWNELNPALGPEPLDEW